MPAKRENTLTREKATDQRRQLTEKRKYLRILFSPGAMRIQKKSGGYANLELYRGE